MKKLLTPRRRQGAKTEVVKAQENFKKIHFFLFLMEKERKTKVATSICLVKLARLISSDL